MVDCVENMKNRGEDYLKSLEGELAKIQVFRRELPLCYELVSQAIEACKGRMKSENGVVDYFHEEQNQHHQESVCNSDQTSSDDGPVLEEFIPIKRRCSLSDESENTTNSTIVRSGEKSDWLRSAQLWNQTPDPPMNKEQKIVDLKKSCGAFKPFINDFIKPSFVLEKSPSSLIAIAPASSSAGTNSAGSRKEEKESIDQSRKQRRCWSPELHRRFLNALQQLGGSHATPKQIREFMKVDGLTNDEVKSHLQKYRLHTRRPSPGTNNNNNNNNEDQLPTQSSGYGILGGLWAQQPQQESTKMEAKTVEGIQSSRRCTSPASSSTCAIAASPMC